MKYLKLFENFDNLVSIRLECEDILLELKEEGGFGTLVTIREESTTNYSPAKTRPGMEYGVTKNQFCKVEISNENRFEYSDISEYVERLKDYMAENNFYCYDFSSYYCWKHYSSSAWNGSGAEKQPKIQVDMRRQLRPWRYVLYYPKCVHYQNQISLCGTRYSEKFQMRIWKWLGNSSPR